MKMLWQIQMVRLHHKVELRGVPTGFPGCSPGSREGFGRPPWENLDHSLSLRDKNCRRCPARHTSHVHEGARMNGDSCLRRRCGRQGDFPTSYNFTPTTCPATPKRLSSPPQEGERMQVRGCPATENPSP
jgi:hypothetical protein